MTFDNPHLYIERNAIPLKEMQSFIEKLRQVTYFGTRRFKKERKEGKERKHNQ